LISLNRLNRGHRHVSRWLATLFVVVVLTGSLGQGQAQAATITIAAAADLTFAFKEFVPEFEKATGDKVKLSFGSSGTFFAQIQNGAPYDLFFSADIGYPKKLDAAGLAEPGTMYEYAVGKIVLWVLNQSPLDLAKGLPILTDERVKKIAIADPAHAPYGKAAVAALKNDKLYDAVKPKIVQGENIAQTAQFVQSGSADIGILALSLALAPALQKQGRYELIPDTLYPPIEQAAVVLKASKEKKAAEAFIAFLEKPETLAKMKQYGFVIPSEQSH
jgi:molybdate transport system substrate-binding protein